MMLQRFLRFFSETRARADEHESKAERQEKRQMNDFITTTASLTLSDFIRVEQKNRASLLQTGPGK